ncbi:MAG: PKD-like domain-containing protein [Bacteroidota bacterium]
MIYITLFKKHITFKKYTTPIFTVLLFALSSFIGYSQCPVTATSSVMTIKCGDQAILSATPFGCRPLDNNFNTGDLGTSWQGTNGAVVTNGTGTYACGGAAPEGTSYMFMGDDVVAPRELKTNSYNLLQCGSNTGTLSFFMKYSKQAQASPCEGPDAANEGVHVQYSVNGIAGPWVDLMYNDPLPSAGTDAVFTNWKKYNLVLPAAAFTATTSFRWYQQTSSAVDTNNDGVVDDFKYDTWALDDVAIILTAPGYTYNWAHDVQGPAATPATPPVTPTTTTTYTVTYTNGIETCTSSVTVNVLNPTITASATPMIICPGQSSQLDSVIGNVNVKPTTCGINSLGCIGTSSLLTVGAGTTTAGIPFDGGMSASTRMQMLYLKSELPAATTAGQINSIGFYVESLSTGSKTFQNCIVKIGCTSMTAFANGSVSPVPNLATVRNAKTVTLVAGWNTLVFDQAYNWDGTSNILVDICWANSGTSSPASTFRNTTTTFQSVYNNNTLFSNNLCDDITPKASTKIRPNIQFGYCDSLLDTSNWIYSWTPTTGLDNPAIKNPIATPSATTTYTVSFYSPSNSVCKSIDSKEVTVSVTPPPTAVGATKCINNSVDLSVTGCSGTVNWFAAATGGTSIFTGSNYTTPVLTTTTTYYASCIVAGCESARVPVVATINNAIIPTFVTPPSICVNDVAPILPTSSTNIPPITGTWNALVSNISSGIYTFTPASGQCATTAQLTVTVNPKVSTTITCGTSTTNSVQFNWTAVAGATGYDVSYQVGINPIVTVGAVGNVLTYIVTGLLPTDSVTITVTPISAPNSCFLAATLTCNATPCVVSSAAISYANPFCSDNTISRAVTLVGSGNYTGGTYSSSGGLIIDANTGDITPNTAGNFPVRYTVLGTGGCPSLIVNTMVNVTDLPTATINYAGSPFCNNNVTQQPVTIAGTAAYTGGTYSSSSGLTIDPVSGAITPSTSLPGNYTVTYTIPAGGGCPSIPITTTIIVTPAPTVVISYATPFCNSITNPQSVVITGTGAYTGGTYSSTSGLSIDTLTGAITPSNCIGGIYTVTYTAIGSGGCQSIIGTTTVIVTELPTATINYAGSPFCNNNVTPVAVTITGTAIYTGGIYTSTPNGLTINPNSGVITPNTSLVGNYTVTYTIPAGGGCPSIPVTTTVIITAAPTAIISYTTPFCISTTIPQSVVVTGTGAYIGGAYSSTSGLSIDAVTGAINPSNSIAGTYLVTYNIPASAGCSMATTSTNVVINGLPIATATPDLQTVCSGESTNIALTSNINGTIFSWTVVQSGVTGAIVGSGNSITQILTNNGITTGTAIYTITPMANGCTGIPITVTITVNPLPVAMATPTLQTICSGQTTGIILTSNLSGTTFSWTFSQSGVNGASNGSGNVISQQLTATSTGLGTVIYTITPMVNSCVGNPISVTIIVTLPPMATVTPPIQTICSEDTTNIILTGNIPGTVFNWNVIQSNVTGASAGTGNSIQQTLQTITTNAGQAVYEVTPLMNGCPGEPVMVVINVNPKPITTVNPTQQTICSGSTTAINMSSNLGGTTYSWSVIQSGVFGATSGTGNLIAQTLTTVGIIQGSVDYIITPITNGCVGNTITVTIIVKPTPEVFGAPTSTICSGESPNIGLFPSIPGTTFTWTVAAIGVTGASNGSGAIIDQILETIGNITGTVIYTITPTANNCVGQSIDIEIKVNPLPIPELEDGIICIDQVTGNSTSTYNLDTGLSNTAYTFIWYYNNSTTPISGAFENNYDAAQSGIYSVEATNTSTGCISNLAFATVTESYPGTDFSAVTSAPFSNNPSITVNVTPVNPNYRYSLDGGIPQESNIFIPVALGIHTVHISDNNNCTDKTLTVFVIGYPHYYTPNGDGINDNWNVIGVNDPNAELYIFDRYGKLIKQISPIGEGWDGTYNGEELPSTDYWFTINYSEPLTGNNNVFKSHFSLKR